jgi:hypothetical protein
MIIRTLLTIYWLRYELDVSKEVVSCITHFSFISLESFTNIYLFAYSDEIESLKKYSAVIEALSVSGGEGCAGKAGDLGDGKAKKTVAITGNPLLKGRPLESLKVLSTFDVAA